MQVKAVRYHFTATNKRKHEGLWGRFRRRPWAAGRAGPTHAYPEPPWCSSWEGRKAQAPGTHLSVGLREAFPENETGEGFCAAWIVRGERKSPRSDSVGKWHMSWGLATRSDTAQQLECGNKNSSKTTNKSQRHDVEVNTLRVLWYYHLQNVHVMKMCFSDIFALHPQFLASISQSPWNFHIDESNGSILCYNIWPLVFSFWKCFTAMKVKRLSCYP